MKALQIDYDITYKWGWGTRGAAGRWKAFSCDPIWYLHSDVCILHKSIFGLGKIGSQILYLFKANLLIILFSLDILRCLETPILWNEMLCFPYISHDSTALCYTEGATQQSTHFRRATDQWEVVQLWTTSFSLQLGGVWVILIGSNHSWASPVFIFWKLAR